MLDFCGDYLTNITGICLKRDVKYSSIPLFILGVFCYGGFFLHRGVFFTRGSFFIGGHFFSQTDKIKQIGPISS